MKIKSSIAMKLFFHILGTFVFLGWSILFSSEVSVGIDKCTGCFTSKLKFLFKPPRPLCSFLICEFPLMGDSLMCTQYSGKISYPVSGVPALFTICRMNDLRSEFYSWNSVYNASRFTALKVGGYVLHCWWKAFICLKLSESWNQPTLVVINLIRHNIPAFDFTILVGNTVLAASPAEQR